MSCLIQESADPKLRMARRALQRAVHRIEEAFRDYEQAKLEVFKAERVITSVPEELINRP